MHKITWSELRISGARPGKILYLDLRCPRHRRLLWQWPWGALACWTHGAQVTNGTVGRSVGVGFCLLHVEPLWGNTTLLGTKRTAKLETKIARPAWTHVKRRSIWPHLCLPLLGRWTCKACGRRLSFWCSVSSSLKHNPLTWNLRKIYRYTHYIPRHPMTVATWLRFSQCDRSELPMEVFFQRMCDLECHLVGLQFCQVLFERWLAHAGTYLRSFKVAWVQFSFWFSVPKPCNPFTLILNVSPPIIKSRGSFYCWGGIQYSGEKLAPSIEFKTLI